MQKLYIDCHSEINIVPGEHFPVKLIKQNFDLSSLGEISSNFHNLDIGMQIEISNKKSTIVAEKISNTTVQLITGWRGIRKARGKR